MDPITVALTDYDDHLRAGGERAVQKALGLTGSSARNQMRKLHPSKICICDRKQAYDVMRDMGEIQEDLPHGWQQMLSFRVGMVLQEHIVEAMAFDGSLTGSEMELETERWIGRCDMVLDPERFAVPFVDATPWVVDIKTTFSNNLKGDFYPTDSQIAQADKYARMLEELVGIEYRPLVYVTTRIDLESRLYFWEWTTDGDCVVYDWDRGEVKIIYGLAHKIEESEAAQEAWLTNDILPDRCGQTPDEHPFACCKLDRRGRKATPKCEFFGRCWETDSFETFKMGEWSVDGEPPPLPL